MRYILVATLGLITCLAIIFKDDIHALWKEEPAVIATAPTPTISKPKQAGPLPTSALALKSVGRIKYLKGNAAAKNLNEEVRRLSLNTEVFEGDLLETAAGSSLHVSLNDGEQLFLKPKTQLIVEEFNQVGQKKSIKRLLRGKLRVISGLIGKSTKDTYQLKTHVATIGVRGTEYGVNLCIETECTNFDGKLTPGLYISVLEGQIESKSRAGVQRVNAGRSYYQNNARSPAQEITASIGTVFDSQELQRLPTIQNKPQPSSRLIDSQGRLIKGSVTAN